MSGDVGGKECVVNMKNNQIKAYVLLNAIYHFSLGVTSVILSIYLHGNGFNYTEISLYSLVFWIFSFILEIPSGFIADLYPTNIVVMLSSFFRGCGIFMIVFSKRLGIISLVFGGVVATIGEALKSGTLEAGITNELVIDGKKEKLNYAFSRSASVLSFFSLVSGYIGSKLFYLIDKRGPFMLALISFIVCGIVSMLFVKDHTIKKKLKNKLFTRNQRIAY